MRALDFLEKPLMKPKAPVFQVGDTVDVHVKIQEGERERIQVFTGTIISRKGAGLTETFTVRRLVQGEGVERIFPVHSPRVADVKVKKHGKIRRAKLYYLRERMGKATKVRERLGRDEDETPATPPAGAPAAAAAAAPAEASKPEAGKHEEKKGEEKKAAAPAK